MHPTLHFHRRKRFAAYRHSTLRHAAAADPRPPVAEPRPTAASLEKRVEWAKATALNFRKLAEKVTRPVARGIMERDAAYWEAKAAELERLRRGRQFVGELFERP